MRAATLLFERLEQSEGNTQRVAALIDFIHQEADESERDLILALLAGASVKRVLPSEALKQLVVSVTQLPRWLFDESYDRVGDLAETITLLLPVPDTKSDQSWSLAHSFSELQQLRKQKDTEAIQQYVLRRWKEIPSKSEQFIFNKLLTGGFRVGVSRGFIIKALARALAVEEGLVSHRLAGQLTTEHPIVALARGDVSETGKSLAPYPFYLALPFETVPVDSNGTSSTTSWQIEWKWDGIRAQMIKRHGAVALWSRGEELISDRFPEIIEQVGAKLPDGTVLDGEILAVRDGKALPFQELQQRITRTRITAPLLRDVPCTFRAYDILEWQGADIRSQPLQERRALLEEIQKRINLEISESLKAASWEELATLRAAIRRGADPRIPAQVEGFMLKHLSGSYGSGRRANGWLKWKVDPLTVDAILLYAQRGHGRRAGVFSDYTFGVWSEPDAQGKRMLLTIAKAYSGLTDTEMAAVTKFVLGNTIDRHGPVHVVTAELVFELGFDSIAPSSRHKSGIALRFPRILRWRHDKPASEADSITTVRSLLRA